MLSAKYLIYQNECTLKNMCHTQFTFIIKAGESKQIDSICKVKNV